MISFDLKHSSYWPYYFKVYKHKKTFDELVEKAKRASSMQEKLKAAQFAAEYAVFHATGYYASPQLEQIFLDAASTIPEVECLPQKDSVLHVMTQAYCSGGHTRVVERWIKLSNQNERHSILILNQRDEIIPDWLKDATSLRCGELITLNEPCILQRAENLRRLAAGYERIILHIHPDDPTAIIAFGVESFRTPVILFNHADHLFWLGASITDLLADLRYDSKPSFYRGIQDRYVLGIPCAPSKNIIVADKKGVRNNLCIPENSFVILTTGTPFKFSRIAKKSLIKHLITIVNSNSNILCYAIGPDLEDAPWRKANHDTSGRIIPLGVISDKQCYLNYLQAADLYIGSYPYPGYTSTMDATQYGLPFLQVLPTKQQRDLLLLRPGLDQSQYLFHSFKQFEKKVLSVEHNYEEYEELVRVTKVWSDEYSNQEEWQKRLYEMYSLSSTIHKIHTPEINQKNGVIDDEMCLVGFMYEQGTFEYSNLFLRKFAHFIINNN